jgi:2-methylcitrate dehydratase PrpD
MTASTSRTVTDQVASWIVDVSDADVPSVTVERVQHLVLDSIGNQFAGMATPTGQRLATWVRAQGAAATCTVTGQDFKTTPALATLLNGATSHALENDDIATFSSHPSSPLTAASLSLGEQHVRSGHEVVVAWAIGWEITAQTMKVCLGPQGNELINRGWFNQGFQETLGVAALSARLLRLDVDQTRMALGHAASAMAGMMKNRGTDTKGFTAGSSAMHGVMAAELAALGFTANRDILDGDLGVARLLGLENGDPKKILEGLGSWDLASRGSSIRLHACCAAAHWSMDAMQKILREQPFEPEDVESIDVEIPAFLTDMVPFHEPTTGLEAKYSLEYDLATVVLDGRAGIHQYTDETARRPLARKLMERVKTVPKDGPLQSRVVVTLCGGEKLERTVNRYHGNVADPLSEDERLGKFHECAATLAPQAQRDRIIDLTAQLDRLPDARELAAELGVPEHPQRGEVHRGL